jgi:hypothetical protein
MEKPRFGGAFSLRIGPAHGRLDSAEWNLGRQTKKRFWE